MFLWCLVIYYYKRNCYYFYINPLSGDKCSKWKYYEKFEDIEGVQDIIETFKLWINNGDIPTF
jgi:hypothetical protein